MVLIETLPGVPGCHIDDVSCRGPILLAFEDKGLAHHIFINAECSLLVRGIFAFVSHFFDQELVCPPWAQN